MPPKKRGRKATPKSTPKSTLKSKASADPSSPPPSPPSAAPPQSSSTATQAPVAPSPPQNDTPTAPSEPQTVESDPTPEIKSETSVANADSDLNSDSVSKTPAVNADSGVTSVSALNVVDETPPAKEVPLVKKKVIITVVKKIVKKKVLKAKLQTCSQADKAENSVSVNLESAVSVYHSETADTCVNAAVDNATAPMEAQEEALDQSETAHTSANVGADDATAAMEEKEETLPGLAETGDVGEKKDVNAREIKVKPEDNQVVKEKKVVLGEEEKGDEGKEVSGDVGVVGDEEGQISERQKRRRTEIFVGGLGRNAKEEDLRNVFSKAGEIVEVRMIMDGQSGKNKGYAFVRYKETGQAKQAVAMFSKVEICGKLCGAAALEGNDTIFIGNINRKWKKEDLIKILQDIGIEKIDTVTVMVDPHNTETNRGFAFLELESNRDAQVAYKKLSKSDAFGKDLNIKVAWAESLNDPDGDEMQNVKSVYVECVPSSWDEAMLMESFNKFGEIERIVLSRNMPSAKRKDFAFVNYTTRGAALSCIESFNKEEIADDSLKVKLKVSLAKPARKAKQNKGMPKLSNNGKVKTKPTQESKFRTTHNESSLRGGPNYGTGEWKFSTTNEFLHPRATWQQGPVGYGRGPAFPEYSHSVVGGKRSYSAMDQGEGAPYPDWRSFPPARFDTSYPIANSSYGAAPQIPPGPSMPYYQRPHAGYGAGPHPYGPGRPNTLQRQGFPPFGNLYPRY